MTLTLFQLYLAVINIAAFIVYTIDFQIYIHGGKGIKPQVLLNLVTICGGALGTIIAEVLWDRKINKLNAQSRIYTIFWLLIQLVVVLGLYGPNHEKAMQYIYEFYASHWFLCIYVVLINIVTFFAFAIDKIKAMLGKWRIRELILLGLALIGGSAGGLLAMDIFNHKVKSMHFMIGVPLMLIAHLFLLICVGIGII